MDKRRDEGNGTDAHDPLTAQLGAIFIRGIKYQSSDDFAGYHKYR